MQHSEGGREEPTYARRTEVPATHSSGIDMNKASETKPQALQKKELALPYAECPMCHGADKQRSWQREDDCETQTRKRMENFSSHSQLHKGAAMHPPTWKGDSH